MSQPQAALHGSALLTALTRTATEVQRARVVQDVLSAAGAGLEEVGYRVAVLSNGEDGFNLRYLTTDPALLALERLAVGDGRRVALDLAGGVARAVREETPVLIEGLRERLRALAGGALADAHLPGLPDLAAAAPLHVRGSPWGALVVMSDALREEDLPALLLFSMQLGSALEVADGFERLERRAAEFDLVHELAVAGPRADARALCRRALETICRTTGSDAGTLHRYDAEASAYVLVGDAFGYRGRLLDAFHRFGVTPGDPGLAAPVALPVSRLAYASGALADEGFAHCAVIPLDIEGTRVGLLSLARRADVAYLPHEVRSAEVLGVQVASLLERGRLYDEAGRLYADLKSSYDELARTQQELVRHERLAALGELAAVMAHEVRNPLGVIFNSLTSLKRLVQPGGDVQMLLSIVGEEADRLNRIVGDLLDFVRPYELVRKPVAVEPILTSAVDAATQGGSAAVRVSLDVPRELPPFPVDAHLLKQALVNLLVNAAQAMPRGGAVQVRAVIEPRDGQAWLCIEVRDEGDGLSPRVAQKMFQPFFTTKATGTGLGLAVVKRIVDGHLGEVSAQPNADGRGATFTLRLPHTTETRTGVATPPMGSASAPRR